MLAFSYAIQWVTPTWRSTINRLSPVFLLLIGAMLIIRGLNLGLPYISPKAQVEQQCVKMKCCKH
ncbi:MAG: hypothetical protein K2Q22_03875 [Cytophagales bacterium]|nr:hypothetical protein [Cytophagales bacterium]